ncbi:MAG: bacillithiol biosynthesis cysteine-adding enzyme BshC [Acidobacteriota bacterium]|nr:bacillithiol biosynthesis cysteine-adding enzyme BshC [Acidobacteriota bacterium]
MSVECFPITVLPHVSPLYRDFLALADTPGDASIRRWYGAAPFTSGARRPRSSSSEAENQLPIHWTASGEQAARTPQHANALADLLEEQAALFHASAAAIANIDKLRSGARAVVTGQQVVLFGGPLLTFLKAATAIARAREASAATGIPHVPIFWMATEDHDLAEVDQVSLLTKFSVETLHANLKVARALPVGGVSLHPKFASGFEAVMDHAAELLEHTSITEWLRECYTSQQGEPPTLALAFGRFIAKVFADQGLIVMDASTRGFHALGASTLRAAVEHAAELRQQLLARSQELVQAGYHAQVLVSDDSSLLFLLDETTGERVALKFSLSPEGDPQWKAGSRTFTSAELLAILDSTPERLSPNALLRPVFQDTLLPTAAYIGGPSEIAYFAQTSLLSQFILGRITPVLPRLSATLIEPAIAKIMDKDEVQLPDAMTTPEALAQRLGARAMPIELKRRLAAVGNALEPELDALTQYLSGIDPTLGRAATVSSSKMQYQMNRLRRMAATFELQKEASLRKHADAITLNVFPNGHPQERVIAGVWFLSRYGEPLIDRLIQAASNQCPGHVVIRL